MRIASGRIDAKLAFVAVDATDLKTRETALSSFTVYRSRNGGAATAYTTPTVAELSAANMPGVYVLTVDEDTTLTAGADEEEYVVHITQAAMAPVTRAVEIFRPKGTEGNALDVNATGGAEVGTFQAGAITAAAFAAGAIDNAAFAVTETLTANPAAGGITAASFGAGAIDAAAIAADAITAAKIAAGAIDAATFAAGAIDAAAIATDAIGSAELSQAAADKVWATAARTITGGTVTTNSDKTGYTLTAAERDNIVKAASGTADSGSTTTIVDAERTEADTDYWAGSIVVMTSGAAVGQARRISAFTPASDTIAVASAFTAAVAIGDTYLILRSSALEAPGAGSTDWTAAERQQIRDALGVDGTKTAATGGQVQAVKTKTDQLVFTLANKVDASIQAAGDFAQGAADKVWSSASRTLTAFSTGLALSVWDVLETAILTASSIGLKVKNNLDSAVTTRSSHTAADVWATATRALTDKAGFSLTAGEHTSIADALLKRDLSAVTGEAVRSVINAMRFLRNKWSISGTTLTVTKEDDATAAWTATLTATAGANPITAKDPIE